VLTSCKHYNLICSKEYFHVVLFVFDAFDKQDPVLALECFSLVDGEEAFGNPMAV